MIRLIAFKELRSLFAAPGTWLMLGALQFILALVFFGRLNEFLQTQAQIALLPDAPGATQAVVPYFFNIAALILLVLTPVFTMRLFAEERRSQTLALLLSAPVSTAHIVIGKFAGVAMFLWMIVVACAAMAATLMLGTAMDAGLLLANACGLMLLTACYAALGLYVSALTAQPVIAAVGALATLLGLWIAESVAPDGLRILRGIAPTGHLHGFNSGLLHSADAVYYLLFCGVFLLLTIRRLDASRAYARTTAASAVSLLKRLGFGALLLGCVVALYLLAARYPLQHDVTQNAINSLEPASVQALQQLRGPVHVTVFSGEQDAQQGDVRKLIRQFVALYQRYKSDISLSFVDPAQHPDDARRAEIQSSGEMVLEYDGRREHLAMLNEQAFTNALLKLVHRKDLLVMYVTGHGERRLDGIANYDLGDFGKRLGQLGFHIASLNLAIAQDVPGNVSVLVLTQPQADWLPGEVDKLLRFVDRGGDVLWLLDPEPLHRLEPLAERLGLVLTPGIVVDPDAEQMRAPPSWTLGANYPPHAMTRGFDFITVFPFARALGRKNKLEWRYSTLVDAAPHGWVSAAPITGSAMPRYNTSRDTHGPVDVALALEREAQGRTQRIVAVGSGSFLANTYAGNGRNLDLGINMVNWLSHQDDVLTIAPRSARDDAVTLSRLQLAVISIGLVFTLPLVLALVGGVTWWRWRS